MNQNNIRINLRVFTQIYWQNFNFLIYFFYKQNRKQASTSINNQPAKAGGLRDFIIVSWLNRDWLALVFKLRYL